ncbi:MAG TPA: chitobiase/beta-hexosaminidase C-terminal domain-containing protein, partial [Verrucomicrobiae bacterium]
LAISPPAGFYAGPIQVALSFLGNGGPIYYRTNAAGSWQQYLVPFGLGNDAVVEYYGLDISGTRSRVYAASYTFGNGIITVPLADLTNDATGTNGNGGAAGGSSGVTLSRQGTIFYGRKNGTGGGIWAINLDGNSDSYITTGARPRVSRDGHYLAFMRGTNVFSPNGGDLWVRDLTTGMERILVTNLSRITGYDFDIASPPRLVFDNGCTFQRVTMDGGVSAFPLANNCNYAAPVVNPLTGDLAFHDLNTGGGIRTVPATGGDSFHLGQTQYGCRWPAWSADGRRLSFGYFNNYYAPNGQADLFTINADGSGLAQISALTNVSDGFPFGTIWTPDNTALVGAGTLYGTNGLWLIPLTMDAQHCDCPAHLLPTSAGDPIDFAGGILTAPAAAIAKPGLFIREDPQAMVVYWSTNYQGFTLQATADLAISNNWQNLAGPYFLNGGYYEYHEALTALARARYFRLQYPGILVLQPLQPWLTVQTGVNQTILSWSTNYVGYQLESTTNLTPPVVWVPWASTNILMNGSGQYEFHRDQRQPQEFFRLHW